MPNPSVSLIQIVTLTKNAIRALVDLHAVQFHVVLMLCVCLNFTMVFVNV